MVLLQRISILLMVFALVSCGFHLRGIDNELKIKHSIWTIENGGEIAFPLRKELLRHKISTVENNPKAAVIQFSQIDLKRQTQSLNRYGGVDDFLYTLHVVAQVFNQGKAWGEPIDLTIERYMSYRTDSLVEQEEERYLLNEMYQGVADSIVNRLYFLPDLTH